eukprot:SAG22_NODE_19460_length_274_cov_1.428571_1_plen_68_part_10
MFNKWSGRKPLVLDGRVRHRYRHQAHQPLWTFYRYTHKLLFTYSRLYKNSKSPAILSSALAGGSAFWV